VAYHQSLQILKEQGTTSSSLETPFYPLNLLRGVIDYLEIIGAILGIILGYYSISKEKGQRTMQLILTRSVKRTEIIIGKLLGNFALIGTVILLIMAIIIVGLWVVGGTMLSAAELVKLVLAMGLAVFYVLLFFCLSSFLALVMKNQSRSLMIGLVIWLVIVLIIPQIGDTMDPDNQVQGGFFKYMGLSRPEEKAVLTHFSTYENIRNAIEQTSVTKNFERADFALLGIKVDYNGKTIRDILKDQLANIIWLLGYLFIGITANYYLINKRDAITGVGT